MVTKVYYPNDLHFDDAIYVEDVQCPYCGKDLLFLVGYEYDEDGARLTAALIKEPCCELSEDDICNLEEQARDGYVAPEKPPWPA